MTKAIEALQAAHTNAVERERDARAEVKRLEAKLKEAQRVAVVREEELREISEALNTLRTARAALKPRAKKGK